MPTSLDQLAINTLRCLSIDMVQQANSWHPGLPMWCAPMARILWDCFLKHNPVDVRWYDRDRFILSAGHGSALLYSLMHITWYDLTLEDLKQFRQWESKTPGHPENFMTPWIEITTWPLWQGLSSAVGFAIAETHLAATYNTKKHTIIDHYTYVLCSDGDHMEWITGEAASLAGHLWLGKLIALYDSNHISIDGSTDLAFTEDVGKRYEAYGWHVSYVKDGDTDLESIADAISQAQQVVDKPSLIIVTTTIWYGSPNKAWSSSAHGSPLGEEECVAAKKQLWRATPGQRFFVPKEIQDYCVTKKQQAIQAQYDRERSFSDYTASEPELARELEDRLKGSISLDIDAVLRACATGEAATRKLSGICLTTLAEKTPAFMWGSADLTPSNNTYLSCSHDFQKKSPDGRNIRFGVREHAMWAIANGLALHGWYIPFVATFLIFTDYMKASMRLAALSGLQVLYIMTHDSIGLWEDGPTHQPVEILAGLRAIPNMYVMRPADATEVAACYALALSLKHSPTTLALTRQWVTNISWTDFDQAKKWCYIVSDDSDLEMLLLASGSELQLAVRAAEELRKQGKKIRVVSMVCMRAFENQSDKYKKSVLPLSVTKRVVIEAGSSFWWGKYAGLEGKYVTVDTFGASAPGDEIMKKFGFSVEHVVEVCNSF